MQVRDALQQRGFEVIPPVIAEGTGNHSTVVYAAKDNKREQMVALKIINLRTKKAKRNYEREVETYHQLREVKTLNSLIEPPFIISALSKWKRKIKFGVIIMKLMEKDLIDFIQQQEMIRGQRDEKECERHAEYRKLMINDICKQIKEMHQRGIAHLDIKPDNMLLIENQSIVNEESEIHPPSYEVNICDFGTSRCFEDNKIKDQVGTTRYMPPEIYNVKNMKRKGCEMELDLSKCDIWSLGVSICVILTGEFPVIIEEDILLFNEEIYAELEEDCKSLLKGMINISPEKRISIDEVLNHPFLN